MTFQPLTFPDGFLWGVATAAHQNEGNNTNNDFWQWEHLPGKTADGSTSGLACDWWDAERQRAEADFERAAEMGLNTLRLSVEWSRIEPQPDRWDEAAIERYRAMLTRLHELGLTPMVTLHHFTNPLWLAERGGWLWREAVPRFRRYSDYVAQKLGDLCNLWCTLNEPMVYAYLSHLTGEWSPGEKSLLRTLRVAAAMAKAHLAAREAIRARQPAARVGLVKHLPILDAAAPRLPDRLAAGAQDRLFNERFFRAVYGNRPAGGDDFVGINYYGRHNIAFDLRRPFTLFGRNVIPPGAEMWDDPWPDREVYPHGLYRAIRRAAAFGKPVYITENGLADAEDARRPRFLLAHLAAVHRAIRDGFDVRGYYYWTLVDNYEWVEGWTTRFGLIALEPETQQRTPRRSAALYRAIARANAITPAMVEEFAPEAMAAIFAESP
ncbi:MAG: glycosyl hydrolase family protein [Caldilineae bacterium]|nr:MAG: glycosyl hydrolase family protein [Caldilineae bacterium]